MSRIKSISNKSTDDIKKYLGVPIQNIKKINNIPLDQRKGFIIEITLTTDTEAGKTITLPLYNQGFFNAQVDWGDGEVSTITSYDDANRIHTYNSLGTYEIQITGEAPSWTNFSATDCMKITDIIHWNKLDKFGGFSRLYGSTSNSGLFYNCQELKSLGRGKIKPNNDLTNLQGLFSVCRKIKKIPKGIFDKCTNLTTLSFSTTFLGCKNLEEIPEDLFKYNTNISTFAFYLTFSGCTGLKNIPIGLFDNNILVSTYGFTETFNGCSELEELPNGLFRNNVNVGTMGFYRTFYNCDKLKLNKNIFYADGEQSTRFKNKVSNFEGCFQISSFTGTQGEAPDLWNCDFGTQTPTTTNCFKSHSSSSLNNYNDIPDDWKGL